MAGGTIADLSDGELRATLANRTGQQGGAEQLVHLGRNNQIVRGEDA